MIMKGKVIGIQKYGVFVKFENEYTGLLHISSIGTNYIRDLNNIFKIGDDIYTKIVETDDENKRYTLSTMDVDYRTGEKFKYYSNGFYILKKHLPIWVDEKVKEYDIKVES